MARRMAIAAVLTLVLIGVWASSAWAAGWTSTPAPPEPAGSIGSGLASVSCTGARNCVAVGYAQTAAGEYDALVERWDGVRWRIQAVPPRTGNVGLYSVSCSRPGDCVAVGDRDTAPGVFTTLSLHWDGRAWREIPTPAPAGAELSVLYGVSCSGPRACMAAGEQIASNRFTPLTEQWDGRAWRIRPTPVPAGSTYSLFGGISCPRWFACTTVGFSSANVQRTLAEHWDGRRWAIQQTKDPADAGLSSLAGVSCAHRWACTAVGFQQVAGGAYRPLIERWNGWRWTINPTPAVPGADNPSLTGVSCPATRDCTAVGGGGPVTLAEHWDGRRWTIEPTPTPPGIASAALRGVSCPSPRACIAVGGSSTSTFHDRLLALSRR